MTTLIGCLTALFTFPFVTIPSLVYGVSHLVVTFTLGTMTNFDDLLLRRGSFASRARAAVHASRIADWVAPVLLIAVVPIAIYLCVWKSAAWMFFAWMVVYFLSRRYTRADIARSVTARQMREAVDAMEPALGLAKDSGVTHGRQALSLVAWLAVSGALVATWEVLGRTIPEGPALVPVNIICVLVSMAIGASGFVSVFRRWVKPEWARFCAVALWFVVFVVLRSLI